MRISHRTRVDRFLQPFVFSLVTAVVATALGQPDNLRPTWECLPEETAVAIRVPDGTAIAQAVIEKTKFGAVLFHQSRMDRVRQFISEQETTEGESFASALFEYGLTPDDIPRLFSGEFGYAIAVNQSHDQPPLAVGIGWLETDAELAQRAYDAVGRSIEMHEDDAHPPERVDIVLSDHPVMVITVPVIRLEYGELELPDDFDNLSEEEQDQAWDRAYEKYEENAVETVTFQTALVTSLGERLLVVHTLKDESDNAKVTTDEQLEVILSRLINAHYGEPGRFLARVTAARGMEILQNVPGDVALEMLGDPAPFLRLARAQEEFQADEHSEKVMRLLGVDQLGPFGMTMWLEGTKLHSDFFLSAPHPRRGLLRLLDQPPLPVEPPAWVPASAVSFSQLSFDLGQAYRIVKEEAGKEFADEADQAFAAAEAQVQNFTQVSLERILDSLGTRHISVSFEPEITEQEVDGVSLPQPQDRMALVWQLEEDETWSRLLNALGAFAAFAPGVESTTEQGFRGWRMENEDIEGGLVVGKGYLVLAIGRGVLETSLSLLNNPPVGKDSLRQSELFERSSALMELRPAVGLELTDADRYAKVLRNMLESLIDEMQYYEEFDDETATSVSRWQDFARELLPDEAEVENIFGVAASEFRITEEGVVLRSVNELPPPD